MPKTAKTAEQYLCILSTRVRISIGRFKAFIVGQVYDRKDIPEGASEKKEIKDEEGAVIGYEPLAPSPVYFKLCVPEEQSDTVKATPKKATKPKEVIPDGD